MVLVRPGARVPADGDRRRGRRGRRRVDDHRRVAAGRQGAWRPRRRGHGRRRRQPARPGHRGRRRDGAVGDHASGGGGPGVGVACPGAGRPGGRPAVLRRARRRRRHARRSGGCSGDPEGALVRTATVLVIACPHALGLAIPLVIAISTSLGARNGLLVKDRLALERARDARHRHLRQDRHAHEGRAGAGRRARRARWTPNACSGSRLPSRRTRSTRSPARSSKVRGSEASRRGRPRTSRRCRAAARARGSHGQDVQVGGPRLLARAGPGRRIRRPRTWDQQGRTVLHVVVDGARRSASWPSRTRSDRSRTRRSTTLHRARRARRDDHRRQPGRRGLGRAPLGHRRGRRAGAAGRQGRRRRSGSSRAAAGSRWSATASTTRRPWPRPTSASRSAPAPTSRSSRPASCSSAATRATSWARSSCRGRPTARCVQNLVWATGYNLVAIPVAMGVLVALGDRPADGGRCDRHEPLDDHRRRQRATAPACTHPSGGHATRASVGHGLVASTTTTVPEDAYCRPRADSSGDPWPAHHPRRRGFARGRVPPGGLVRDRPGSGATESVVTGSVLVAFAIGWLLLGALSTRFTDRPQRWAFVPAAGMGLVGLGLIDRRATRPGDGGSQLAVATSRSDPCRLDRRPGPPGLAGPFEVARLSRGRCPRGARDRRRVRDAVGGPRQRHLSDTRASRRYRRTDDAHRVHRNGRADRRIRVRPGRGFALLGPYRPGGQRDHSRVPL